MRGSSRVRLWTALWIVYLVWGSTYLGIKVAVRTLPPLLTAVRDANFRSAASTGEAARPKVLWVCDPMHGNSTTTVSGVKTRSFDEILRELELAIDLHRRAGTILGGVHFELTGEDVTECIGRGVSEGDLTSNYASPCDPRLNYHQALEMAFAIASRMG